MLGEDSVWSAALGLIVGVLLGALLTALLRARREQSLRVELEVLRSRDSQRSNDELVLQLTRERLGRQQQDAAQALEARQTAIDAMLAPIREALNRTEAQMRGIERDRIDSFATLRSQMELLAGGQTQLARETRNLVTALRRPDVRGQWGELSLRRLVELAGMSDRVDFTEQAQQMTEDGAIRPDMIVHLPERRDIVVDVKTPLDAYLAAVEADDDGERAAQLRRHALIVGNRVRELAGKRYWSQFEHSPDFVVMFLPGDQFLTAALEINPGLIDEALRQNVMMATPTSLVALLKAVAYGWKQAVLADNAAEIRRLGEDVHKRLAVFGEHLARLGKSLGGSVESFNKAVGSLEQQVLPAARRFPELGLRVTRELEVLEPVDGRPRVPREPGEEPRGVA